jgi:hypothetical protein
VDLILSEEPSTDARVLELEPAEVEVDPLVDVQSGKVFSMSTLPFVSKHFQYLSFQYVLGLISYLCLHPCRLIHLINLTSCVLLMSLMRKRLSSRFGDPKKKLYRCHS